MSVNIFLFFIFEVRSDNIQARKREIERDKRGNNIKPRMKYMVPTVVPKPL